MKEAESFIILIFSIVLALFLLPLQIIVLAIRFCKTFLKIVEETISHFIELIQKETIKK